MSLPERFRPHCLKVEVWPPACRDAWETALLPPGLFDDAKPAANWRPATIEKIRKGFGAYLHWLTCQEWLGEGVSPAELVSRERAKLYKTTLGEIGSAPLTIYNRLDEMHLAMRALAPQVDWSWLSQAVQQLRKSARPVRHKLCSMQPVPVLVELGADLMKRAEADIKLSDHKRALMFRDGLMIALLVRRPFRLKNFGALTIGASLVLKGERGSLVFAGNETKAKRPIDLSFPDTLWHSLQTYLIVYRPYLLGLQQLELSSPVDALWISNEGRPLVEGTIRVAIRKRTRAAFGQYLWPHLFRDCAVTTLVRDDPASARLARDILSHTNIDTTNAHYNQAQMIETSRRHLATIEYLERTLMDQDIGIDALPDA